MLLLRFKKEFTDRFYSLTHRRNEFDVFRDWCEVASIVAHQTHYNLGLFPKDDIYQELEARYMEFVPQYGKEGLQTFSEMFGVVQYALHLGKTDFLGEIFQELGLNSKRKGEFFTPYTVSKAMAQMLFSKETIQMAIDEKGFVSISEPACGAGGMLIAACEVIEELGFEPRRMVFFEATDIDRLCFDMTYIQLSVLGIPGFVCHGNTLSQEMWTRRPTPQLQLSLKRDEVDPAAWTMLSLLSKLKPSDGGGQVLEASPPELPPASDGDSEKKSTPPASPPEEAQPRQLELFSDWQGERSNE